MTAGATDVTHLANGLVVHSVACYRDGQAKARSSRVHSGTRTVEAGFVFLFGDRAPLRGWPPLPPHV